MKPLVLHPTETSQWQALVNEAQASTCLVLNEELESYLVFLLMRFSQRAQLMESILALDFLNAMHKSRSLQLDALQEVGDKSLLFCGLFPNIADKHRVSLDYLKNLGQTAYLTVGELHDNSRSPLYFQLSAQFVRLKNILQAMRGEYNQIKTLKKAVLAEESLPLH